MTAMSKPGRHGCSRWRPRTEPEPVRQFAQTYLRCHHPGISAEQPEASRCTEPAAAQRPSYTAERIWPALFDLRPDVRRFAVTITRSELRRWGYHAGL